MLNHSMQIFYQFVSGSLVDFVNNSIWIVYSLVNPDTFDNLEIKLSSFFISWWVFFKTFRKIDKDQYFYQKPAGQFEVTRKA